MSETLKASFISQPRVNDQASHEKIKSMFDAIKACECVDETDMTDAENAWLACCATFLISYIPLLKRMGCQRQIKDGSSGAKLT